MKFSTLKRTGKPNDFLVADAISCEAATPNQTAPVYNVQPSVLYEVLVSYLESQPRVEVREKDADAFQIHATETTKTLKFVDDVYLSCAPLETKNATRLLAYSRSRTGYSDLGTNRRRLETWLSAISDKLKKM